MAAHTPLDTLIRPVFETLLLEVHGLLQRSADLPGDQQPGDNPPLLPQSPPLPLPPSIAGSTSTQVPNNSMENLNTAAHTSEYHLIAKLAHLELSPPKKHNEESLLNEALAKDLNEPKDEEHVSHTKAPLKDLVTPNSTEHHKTEQSDPPEKKPSCQH